MNTTTTHSAFKRRTGPLLIGAALVGVLALAGCTPDAAGPTTTPTTTTPTPTPTPTETGVPAPQSEDEAVDAAEDVIGRYLLVRSQVNAAGGTDTAPLDTVATGTALQIAKDDAARIVTDKNTVSGQLKFERISAYAGDLQSPDGTITPFGSATVTGCQDGSEYKLFNADGSAAQQPTNLRNVLEFTAIWEPSDGTWLVQNVVATGSTC
ncbi:hypothetical protein C5D98_15060 [Rathayibacter rathayi]|uniref:hypothetical protein n=1 Tax=Rathayibacter rathayi TaxID=33887 RepID=UPI000CE85488|nr:hypothetical protein [Rathayibacter rathayi]PPG77500.1 hypothetical protein C5C15_09405 [Rathayibacter rathayi]PPG94336.1 hypothetical protein C5C22_09140 [Rathayibacter rathayi]PPI65268.1 hypothetical protein C5D98_15060 [Rathayibacter rathayi]